MRVLEWGSDWALRLAAWIVVLVVLIGLGSHLILQLGRLFNGEMPKDHIDDLFHGRLGGNWNYVSWAINALCSISAVLLLVFGVVGAVVVVIKCLRWAWEKWRRLKDDESKEVDQ